MVGVLSVHVLHLIVQVFESRGVAWTFALCERRLEGLNLVVLMIDGIHFGGQVPVVAVGIAESGEKHVLGVWQGATENTAWSKDCWKIWWIVDWISSDGICW